jgi:hypothetical protein
MRPPRIATFLAVSALLGGAALPAPARAAEPGGSPGSESFKVKAGEIADSLRKAAIGVVTISVGFGRDNREEAVQTYTREADAFAPAGALQLGTTQPVSGWISGTEGVTPVVQRAVARRYLIVERRADYVRAALDLAGQRTAWVRRTPDGVFPNTVEFVDFGDAGSFRCYQIDPFFFAPGERKLFEAPDKGAKARPLAGVAGRPGYLDADLVPLQRKANFFEVAAVKEVNDPKTSIGWIEIKDDAGRLTLWLSPGPEC